MSIERWQDYDCPNSGIDFDIAESDMLFEGDAFHCSGCGSQHVATRDLVQQYERKDGEESARIVPLQKRATA